jgi:hypothetical protein
LKPPSALADTDAWPRPTASIFMDRRANAATAFVSCADRFRPVSPRVSPTCANARWGATFRPTARRRRSHEGLQRGFHLPPLELELADLAGKRSARRGGAGGPPRARGRGR